MVKQCFLSCNYFVKNLQTCSAKARSTKSCIFKKLRFLTEPWPWWCKISNYPNNIMKFLQPMQILQFSSFQKSVWKGGLLVTKTLKWEFQKMPKFLTSWGTFQLQQRKTPQFLKFYVFVRTCFLGITTSSSSEFVLISVFCLRSTTSAIIINLQRRGVG